MLPPHLLAILRALIEEHVGIEYRPDDRPIFSDKVSARAREAGFERVLDYYYFLRHDPNGATELGALVDQLVVSETYFFRELEPARAAVHEVVVPALAMSKSGRARIWCAACATGEEPLSLAMLLMEAGILDRCEIVASDVSARAIARARANRYTARSLRALPPPDPASTGGWTPRLAAIASECLLRDDTADGTRTVCRVSPELVAKIDYRQVNLLDAKAVSDLGTFDLVLCRNVIIYLCDAAIRRVLVSLVQALAPGERSSILVGASESLLRFGTLLCCAMRGGTFFYAKPSSS